MPNHARSHAHTIHKCDTVRDVRSHVFSLCSNRPISSGLCGSIVSSQRTPSFEGKQKRKKEKEKEERGKKGDAAQRPYTPAIMLLALAIPSGLSGSWQYSQDRTSLQK